MADLLIPLFTAPAIGVMFAQAVARSALDEYQPETGADYVSAARTIAFSLAALALLGHAADRDMTMPEKIRVLGRANALNRSADQSERTMMQRRRHLNAGEKSPSTPRVSEPLDTLTAAEDDAVKDSVAQALAACNATFSKPEPAVHQTAPAPALNLGPPPVQASAIHYQDTRPLSLAPRKPQPSNNIAIPAGVGSTPPGQSRASHSV